jgi:iron complex outermembrane receptor protein
MSIHSITSPLVLFTLVLVAPTSVCAQDSSFIEEIIVTAQKREQSAQDVGIAITATDGNSLREDGIDRPEDLHTLVTNVGLQNIGGGGIPIVIVRGIGLQSLRINDSPTTAFYVDEVYQPSVASAEWTMFDLERVEILKGPQGGLYGRNALGGAIQIISNKPDINAGPNGYLQVGYDEYSQFEFEGATDVGLSRTLALRLAGRWVEGSDAAYRDITLNENRGKEDRYAGRAMLRYTPSSSFDLLFKLHGGRDNSQLPPLRPMGIYADIGTGAALGAPGVSLGFLNGALGLGLGDPLCASVRAGQGMDTATCADISGVTQDDYGIESDRYTSPSGFPGSRESDWRGISANLLFDLGAYTIQSISAFDEIDYRRVVDFDGTPLAHQHIDYGTKIDSISQEFRLFSDTDSASWVLGLSYGEDDLVESSVLVSSDGVLPLLFSGGVFSPQNYTQETTAYALFGHVEWAISNSINFVGELRYTNAEKKFSGGSRIGFPDGSTAPLVSTTDKVDFRSPSGKIGLEYKQNDSVLWYGSLSRGFKTGGFFGGFATNVEQLQPFGEETVLAYEAGFKSELNSGRVRLNGSVFFYDRSDVQQNAGEAGSVVQVKRIANIGDVEARGAELELTWIPIDELTMIVGVGTTNSEVSNSNFVQSASLPLLPDASVEGTNTPNYSKLSANFFVRYDFNIGNKYEWFLQTDGRYQSESDLSIITDPIEEAVFQEDGFALINLRAGFGTASGSWKLFGYVENAGDKQYRTTVRNDGTFGVYELYGQPRTAGVRFVYSWP